MQSNDLDDPFISENGEGKTVFKPVPGGGFGGSSQNSGFGDFAPPAQYTPSGLKQVYKPQWMPVMMPGWGPYGDEYPIEGDPKWTSRRYYVPAGDVIIAINDRRVNNMKEYQTALVKAGRYVVLTIASHNGEDVYCMCARVRNHRLPLNVADSFYGDDLSDAVGALATIIRNKNLMPCEDAFTWIIFAYKVSIIINCIIRAMLITKIIISIFICEIFFTFIYAFMFFLNFYREIFRTIL